MSLATALVVGALFGAPAKDAPSDATRATLGTFAIRYAQYVAPLSSARFEGRGVDAYERVQTIESPGRDSGLVRPTFHLVELSWTQVLHEHVGLVLGAGGTWGKADAAPPAGRDPVLNGGYVSGFRLSLEPHLRAESGGLAIAAGVAAAYGHFQTSLVGLRAPPCARCSNRASASTFALIPRATVDLALGRIWESGSHAASIGLRAVAGLDVLRLDGSRSWPFELGLGVTLAFARRDEAQPPP